jgi:arginine decarboxylase
MTRLIESNPPPIIRPNKEEEWTTASSSALYQVDGWGRPYVSVGERGNVLVTPNPEQDTSIDLHDLSVELQARGLDMPLLVRFPDIVRHRIARLNQAFRQAISEYGYDGEYRGVFPVKVNQQHHLIEDIVAFGEEFNYGLEAGSKPELLIALSAMRSSSGLIICNGYKDRAYLETALLAQRLDKKVIVVLERLEEVELAIQASRKLGIHPCWGCGPS